MTARENTPTPTVVGGRGEQAHATGRAKRVSVDWTGFMGCLV